MVHIHMESKLLLLYWLCVFIHKLNGVESIWANYN